jgi:hypothetical protein
MTVTMGWNAITYLEKCWIMKKREKWIPTSEHEKVIEWFRVFKNQAHSQVKHVNE